MFYFIVECEKLFCKTNIKLKVLKLNKTKFISKPWRHKIEKIWTALANRVNSRRFLESLPYCQMVSGGCLSGEILSKCFNLSLGVVRSLPWDPCDRAVKTLAANAGGRGIESHRGQNLFLTIYSILQSGM